jgi:hypothetical protein
MTPVQGYILLSPVAWHADVRYRGLQRPNTGQVLQPIDLSPARDVWYIEANATFSDDRWRDFIPDEATALQIRRLYHEHGFQFEIVHATLGEAIAEERAAAHNETFLGFDVATFEPISAIYEFLMGDADSGRLAPVWRLAQAYYKPLLNDYGLLDSISQANHLRDFVRALATVCSDEVEPENADMHVFSLSIVSA